MIISDTKNFLFVHIPKTGGMSIRRELQDFATVPVWAHNQYKVKGQTNKELEKHATARTLKKYISNKKWNNYFKFAFVRNPWDWMVSVYFYIKRDKNDSRYALANRLNFKGFLNWFYTCDNKKYHIRNGQLHYMKINNQIGMDFIGRLEKISDDFFVICTKLGISKQIKKVNTTRHLEYRQYYDAYTKNLIYKMFKEDINVFKYEF